MYPKSLKKIHVDAAPPDSPRSLCSIPCLDLRWKIDDAPRYCRRSRKGGCLITTFSVHNLQKDMMLVCFFTNLSNCAGYKKNQMHAIQWLFDITPFAMSRLGCIWWTSSSRAAVVSHERQKNDHKWKMQRSICRIGLWGTESPWMQEDLMFL